MEPPIRAQRRAGLIPDKHLLQGPQRNNWQPKPKPQRGEKKKPEKIDRSKPITWQVGMITAPRRESTILRTAQSLAEAGWPSFHIFADGIRRPQELNLVATERTRSIGGFCNWWLALWELWLIAPHADRYLLVEDDVVFCKHVREYLDSIIIPDAGILSIYTATGRQSRQSPGFHPTKSNITGIGALAYVMTNQQAIRILQDAKFFMGHRVGTGRSQGIHAQDSAISRWCKARGLRELYHTPSLAQHIGDTPAIKGHGKNIGKRRSDSFPGEDWDARKTREYNVYGIQRGNKLALVGYNVAEPVGEINRRIADEVEIDKWLVRVHPRMPTLENHEMVDTTICRFNCRRRKQTLIDFLQGVGAVVFVNLPVHQELMEYCRASKIATICVQTGNKPAPPGADVVVPFGDDDWKSRGKRITDAIQLVKK